MAVLSPSKRGWFGILRENTSNLRRRTHMDTEDGFKGTGTRTKTKRERLVPEADRMNSLVFGRAVRVLGLLTPDTNC